MSPDLSQPMLAFTQAAGQAHAEFLNTLSPEQVAKMNQLMEAGACLGADVRFGRDAVEATLYLQGPNGETHLLHQRSNPLADATPRH